MAAGPAKKIFDRRWLRQGSFDAQVSFLLNRGRNEHFGREKIAYLGVPFSASFYGSRPEMVRPTIVDRQDKLLVHQLSRLSVVGVSYAT